MSHLDFFRCAEDFLQEGCHPTLRLKNRRLHMHEGRDELLQRSALAMTRSTRHLPRKPNLNPEHIPSRLGSAQTVNPGVASLFGQRGLGSAEGRARATPSWLSALPETVPAAAPRTNASEARWVSIEVGKEEEKRRMNCAAEESARMRKQTSVGIGRLSRELASGQALAALPSVLVYDPVPDPIRRFVRDRHDVHGDLLSRC